MEEGRYKVVGDFVVIRGVENVKEWDVSVFHVDAKEVVRLQGGNDTETHVLFLEVDSFLMSVNAGLMVRMDDKESVWICPRCGKEEDHVGMVYYPMDNECRWM